MTDDKPPFAQRLVLVVEDDVQLRESLCAYLEDEGFETEGAADGAEALARAHIHRPDAIVLDLLMPVMDGLQLMEALSDEPELASIPIFVVSGHAEEAPRADRVSVFSKPVDVEALLRALQEKTRVTSSSVN
jgi:two-component system cell cycle response regulator DivK